MGLGHFNSSLPALVQWMYVTQCGKKKWLLVTLGFLQLVWTMQDLCKEFPRQLLTPCNTGTKQLLAHSVYHAFHTAQQSAVYTPSIELCLWNGSHVALNHSFLSLSLELICRNCHLPSTYSALQLAVEHRRECTDWLKTKNTVSQIIQTGSRYHTVSYSVGIWVISWE